MYPLNQQLKCQEQQQPNFWLPFDLYLLKSRAWLDIAIQNKAIQGNMSDLILG
jgi:hypothetical protein